MPTSRARPAGVAAALRRYSPFVPRPAAAARAYRAWALVLATCLLAAACSATAPSPTPTVTSPAATPTPTTSEASAAPTSAEVESTGTSVSSDEARIHVLPVGGATLEQTKDDDGSVHLTLVPPAATTPSTPVAYVSGSAATVLADGTATAGGGGLSPSQGRFVNSSKDVLALLPREGGDDVAVWFAGSTIETTSWGIDEGGRSLAVTPTAWARGGGLAASDLTWAQLVQREPEADSPTMHAQLRCHELGAPDKDTWNLEPWRPDVSDLEMIAARCNPT